MRVTTPSYDIYPSSNTYPSKETRPVRPNLGFTLLNARTLAVESIDGSSRVGYNDKASKI